MSKMKKSNLLEVKGVTADYRRYKDGVSLWRHPHVSEREVWKSGFGFADPNLGKEEAADVTRKSELQLTVRGCPDQVVFLPLISVWLFNNIIQYLII